jgi:hypothetical protein
MSNNIHEKFFNSDWLRAVQFFQIQYQKVKYSAKSENNTKNPNIYEWQNMAGVFSRFFNPTHGHDRIIFLCILINNSTVSRGIWKNMYSWVFKRLRAILIVLCIFFPNCTRNHTNPPLVANCPAVILNNARIVWKIGRTDIFGCSNAELTAIALCTSMDCKITG